MPSFPAMLRKTLVDAYDCLQLLVFGNVLWCVAWLIPVFLMAVVGPDVRASGRPPAAHVTLAILVGLAVAACTVGPATVGLAALARSITRRQDPRLADFFRGVRGFYLRGAGLFALNAAVVTIWVANLMFWSSSGPGGQRIGQLGSFALLTLLSYAMLYWLLMQMYCPAFIVREDIGVLRATKRSALLVLGNIGYSALVFAQLALLGAIIALPAVVHVPFLAGISLMLVLFLAMGFAMLLGAAALEDLMQQYDNS